ncbi:MAG TPA: DUF169 domain-containing protein [Methanobacterium subterraneum]|uniref:DUF169 domain-containing protein n=1 Tax=Methanobacterium subterraneum TaxID=59277 RepID=A0A7J4TL24_9EURY|nr:DUF169 domain-containing protein [Methanobacterium subterraneum]
MDVNEVKRMGKSMKSILELGGYPVGVRFIEVDDDFPKDAEVLKKHRYCQALMKARKGSDVLLTGEEISCPAAARAFGFRPLPESLKSGKGLVGFGIVSDLEVGTKMFEGMLILDENKIKGIHLFPLENSPEIPDIIIVEDDPEKLMWIALAYLHATGGERIESSTAILQATCVDSTIIPFIKNRVNLTYGCYGCRDATDLSEKEAIMGFPGSYLPLIMEHLKYLEERAIPRSRDKGALSVLEGKSQIKTCENGGN